jgi:hypothetical protein
MGHIILASACKTQGMDCVARKGLKGGMYPLGSEGFRFAAHPRYDLFRPPGSGIAMFFRPQGTKR